jgi:hypothetical protein
VAAPPRNHKRESLRLQYAPRQRACELGWLEADINGIDADLGLSSAAASHRQGFKDQVARVALGEVGLILSIEVTRLARDCSDWCPLLGVSGHRRYCAKQHLSSRRIETEFGGKYLITLASVEKHAGVGRSFVVRRR